MSCPHVTEDGFCLAHGGCVCLGAVMDHAGPLVAAVLNVIDAFNDLPPEVQADLVEATNDARAGES